MNDLELNAQAEGVMTYLKSHTDNPLEGLAVLGMCVCMFYDTCYDQSIPFAKFAQDFHNSLVDTHKDVSNIGPTTRQ